MTCCTSSSPTEASIPPREPKCSKSSVLKQNQHKAGTPVLALCVCRISFVYSWHEFVCSLHEFVCSLHKKGATIRNFLIVQTEGSRQVTRAKAETEFEKYRIIQDRLYQSNFDRFMLPRLPREDAENE